MATATIASATKLKPHSGFAAATPWKITTSPYPTNRNGRYSFLNISLKMIANPIAGSIAPADESPCCNHSGICWIALLSES